MQKVNVSPIRSEAKYDNARALVMSSSDAEMKGLWRELVSEGLGTALLLATVVGSGIMGERLAGGNVAVALLANTLATGAHFNPVVSVCDAWMGGLAWRKVPPYLAAQIAGAFVGVAMANSMFDLPIYSASTHIRTGPSQWMSESIATFGLLAVIWGTSRRRSSVVPFAVGAYITAAYWFTSSTSFANPAVTLARSATDTFAGIRPLDTPTFILAQFLGAVAATAIFRWLAPNLPATAAEIVVPHDGVETLNPGKP